MSRSISASQISNPINRLQTAYVLDEVAESMTINSAFEPGDPECDQLDITFTTIERILQELESEDVQPVDEEALISDTESMEGSEDDYTSDEEASYFPELAQIGAWVEDLSHHGVTGTNESFIEDFERCLMELDLNEHRSFSETDEVVSKLDTRPDIPSKRQGLRLHFDQVDNSAGD